MKKILSLILVMMAVTLPVIAQESTSSSSTRRVGLEVTQTYGHPTTAHRAPMRIMTLSPKYPCYGDYAHNYVINYNGDVFKCTARDFHTENRIGIITETGEIAFNDKALQRVRDSYTSECYVCRRLPICPICSQVRSEAHDGKCPVKITQQEISVNIKQYFFDLHANFQQTN